MNKWLVLLVLLIFLALFLLIPHSASGATLVQELNWRDAAGRLIDGGCSITPIGEFVAPSTWRIAGVPVAYIIARGVFSANLVPTDTATPSGQYYVVNCVINKVTRPPTIWLVPTTGATLAVKDVEATALPPLSTVQWSQLVNIDLSNGPYSVYMPNPSYPPAYLINSASTGDVDLYTVPANRKALLLGWVVTNPPFALTVNNYLETKIGGAYYRTSNTASTLGNSIGYDQTTTVDMLPKVLNAGETASLNMDTAGLSTWLHLIEFDASSPLRSVTLTAFVAGQNTLYTVPTGKTFQVLPLYARLPSNVFSSLRAYLFFSNGTNTTLGLALHAVPNGGSVSVNNALAGVANISGGAVSSTGAFSGSLAPGDFLSVGTGTNASGQMAWMNIIEH